MRQLLIRRFNMFALASRLLLDWYRLSLESCFYNEMTGNGYLDEDDRDAWK